MNHTAFLIAKSRQSLHEQVALFDRWLQQVPCLDDDFSFLAHVSQQLLLKRTISHEHLAIFVSINRAHLQHQIESFLIQKLLSGVHITERPSQSNCRVCFVFSGQGPQWWGMGRQLYSNEPVYRQWIERIDKQFTVINNSEWCLLQELIEKSEQESRVNDTNIAQPALFAVQVALAGLLVSWHIFPSAIVSHSAGEQAAAFVSGRVTLEEAVRVVYHRSRLQHRNTRQGGSMLSVGMSEREAHEFLLQGIENQVSIAAVNSPRSVTLSGDSTIIDELQQILSTFYPNVFKTQLRIENSFHSHQMDRFNIREEILSSLDDIQGAPLLDAQDMFDSRCSHARLYSSVCGSHLKDETLLNAHYWWSNIRQCVRFSDAIQAIVQDNIIDAFLEISPHPVLSTSMRECCDVTSTNSQLRILPTLKRKEDEHATLLTSLAQLSQSSNVWQHYLASRSIQSTRNEDDLFDTFPLYAFSMTSCWYESKDSAMERLAHRLPVHPLLGVRQWTQQTSATWKSLINLNLTKHAYLQHHKIHGTIMFPAAGFLELALAACRQLLPQPNENEPLLPVAFEQVEFVNALILTEQEHTEVFTQIVMPMQEWLIYSRPWSKGEQDCLRSSGIACSDVLDSFVDPNILNTTSLREFTLHARGRIDVGLHLNTFASLAVRLHDNIANWRVLKPTQVYAHLSTRGYQYGSSFQVTDSFQVTASQAISHVCAKNNEQNDAHYHLHPVTLDGCLHGFMSLLPGVQTFLPFSVNKMIAYGSSFHVPQLIVHATFYPSLAGLSHEHSFAVDLAAYDGREEVITSSTKPVFIFEMFKVRPMSGRWSVSNKSVFERVNELVDLPNADSTEQIDRIMTEHCFQKKWSYMPNEAVTERNLLPSSYTLLDKVNKMEKLNSAGNEIHHQLTHSIEPLNALVANYALQALTHLASLNKTSCIIEHELHSRVRNDEPYYTRLFHACLSFVRHYGLLDEYGNTTSVINAHSIQLIRKQLLGQYPLLKPLLSILHANGSSLGQILSGACDVIALFTENKSNELAMQEVQTLIASLRTDIIFKALTIHIRDARFQRLRVLIVGGGTSSIGLTVLRQLIGFAEETSVRVHILYVDVTTELLLEAEQTFQSVLKDINKKRPQVLVSYQAYNMEDDVNESINLGKF